MGVSGVGSEAPHSSLRAISGVWQPAVALESRPLHDFTGITTISVSCRNTSVGGNGAVIQIHADRQGGTHAPILCYVQLQSDGTQSLTLHGKSSDCSRHYISILGGAADREQAFLPSKV